MGSCNNKATVTDAAISRINITEIREPYQENLFTKSTDRKLEKPSKDEQNTLMPLDLLSQSQIPRRSSQLFPLSPGQKPARSGSFNGLSSKGSVAQSMPKQESDKQLIKTALSKHFIFSSLTEVQLDAITNEMQFFAFPTQTIIFEQNSIGDNFFIIAKGKVEVVINLKVAAILNIGDSFGEVALLHDTPRTATIITLQETIL